MVDTLEKTLDKGVAPLENTMGSFAISSRWGPNFNLNLSMMTKDKIRYAPKEQEKNPAATASKELKGIEEKAEQIQQPPVTGGAPKSADKQIEERQAKQAAAQEILIEGFANYRDASQSQGDGEFSARVIPMLNQMLSSFKRLQSKWGELATATGFHTKAECKV
jgi:hypothetical protein